ncbi:MAG TPA: chromosome segregation protein SMC, partial [Deltaproteobacteria bacterium]|nr:chromosome segregation protein SMC [Deltaproteobacteria bacterium]
VGPNGCGKSNIVDAIRWVMGEMSAKHLRGKSMEDVIFSGSQARPATNFAEVTMILANEDGLAPAAFAEYSEIAVTRRLFRSGESEYALNKTPCRLRDIYDLFLGSGVGTKAYSIIEQGKIGQIITAKPEDRRTIIEEAAGISKFKSRKEAALRKLEATQGNLLRLTDILNELKRQIASIDRQARKAERYREVEMQLRELDLHLSSYDFLQASQKQGELENEVGEIQDKETSLTVSVSRNEAQVEADRLDLVEQERRHMSLQELLYEKNNSLQLHQAGIDYKNREIESLAKQNEAAVQEIETIKARVSSLDALVRESNERQVGIDLELAAAEENFHRLEAELQGLLAEEKDEGQKVERLGQSMLELLHRISEQNSRKEALARRKIDVAGRIGKDQAEIDELDRLLKTQQGRLGQVQASLGEVKQFKLDLVQQTDNIAGSILEQREEQKVGEAKLEELKDKLGLVRSRLTSLEELERNFEGYKDGVRNVMLKRHQIAPEAAIYGTVADIVETESAYETAVGAVLGEKLQYVVVQSQSAGVEALQYLKTESMGRLSCIPLQVREHSGEEDFPYTEEQGVIGPLRRFVRVKGDYDKVGDYLFGDVYLVNNLNRALELWNNNGHRKTLVTLDGEVVDPSGVVSGGSRESGDQAILEKKREIKELRQQVFEAEGQVREQASQVERMTARLQMLEQSLETVKRDSHSEELKIVHQEQDLNHLQNEIRRLSERRDKLSFEIAAAMQEESEQVAELQRLEAVAVELESAKTGLQGETESAKQKLAELRQTLEERRAQVFEQKSLWTVVAEKKANLERELQRLMEDRTQSQGMLDEKHLSITSANAQTLQLKQEIEDSRGQLSRLVVEIQEKEAQALQLRDAIQALKDSVSNGEIELRQHRTQLESLRQSLHQKILHLSEGRTRIQVLVQQVLERYHSDLASIAPQYAERPIDRDRQAAEVLELRERLEKIGPVNIDAISEYEELKKRHEFLDTQYQDLSRSLEALQQALQKINRTTKKRFQETFDTVNKLFQEVFPKLFKGGRAELLLTDPDNILESGVEIIAQPPGKKLQSVSLLSGGEKALTAVSLVFAIFIIKPSPFCLLDEVDAPLDDANIDRFNDMVRSLVDRSQFILITHNKRSMEMADTLYGITMEQPGVSKLVSVQLN